MFNVERLRILAAVERHGSVSGAAAGLHVTTSAVSQQMAKLERECGQRLVVRQGRGIRLTDAGRLLAGHASRVLSQLELAYADLEAHRGAAVGDLHISAFPTAARGLMPAALVALRAEHPGLRPRLSEVEPEAAVRHVARGDTDLAVVLDWYNRPLPIPAGLAKKPLLDDPVDALVPVGHRLADPERTEAIGLGDLADEEWICWTEGGFCRDWLLFTLRGQGVEPKLSHAAEEHHTQFVLVAAGLGVAVAPRLGRDPMPEGVAVLPVRPVMRRHVYAVWREDGDRRPSIRAALNALEKAAAEAR
ncbi:LysR family transcriptional regulator [Mangrovactinospora gilvigrisea]|uniref:LysR family transcriptional regulator n=1 Tax=Mangrovactinospora gilvigrisea TaxID=1428644 RepID=A0A1J7BSU4_9ACTN|nr:LysR family transcriptional regulator [Mangrovactinospora gilvigrisea]OIV36545.1 LysR family transcriptional regulator [Mangrovactinospora gilvigrisea]